MGDRTQVKKLLKRYRAFMEQMEEQDRKGYVYSGEVREVPVEGETHKVRFYDCVSRVFAPKLRIPEDPVTGSAHCMIAPYWTEKLGKRIISAFQASERTGKLVCSVEGDRVLIKGSAAVYSSAELFV